MAQLSLPFADLPGLLYEPNFLTPSEEMAIVEFVSAQGHWMPFGTRKRRLIYGFSYAVSSRRIEGRGLPIPPLLEAVALRLRDAGLIEAAAEQVVVQDYPPGIGIGRHIDSTAFGPGVVTLSLLSACIMRFRNIARPSQRVDQVLERRSALAIRGAARIEWTHEILPRSVVARRLSIAFRTVAREPDVLSP